jgi:hypothetical protein
LRSRFCAKVYNVAFPAALAFFHLAFAKAESRALTAVLIRLFDLGAAYVRPQTCRKRSNLCKVNWVRSSVLLGDKLDPSRMALLRKEG